MGVTIYAVDPGVVSTDIFRHLGRPLQEMASRFNCLLRSAADGASTTMYCVVTAEQDLATGEYYRLVLGSCRCFFYMD